MDASRVRVPGAGPFRHVPQLDPADRRLHLDHAPVGAEALVQPAEARRVLTLVHRVPAFPVVLIRPHALPKIVVVDSDHSAFASSRHDLVLAEGPRADVADRADAAASIAGAVCLCAVLDHLDPARARKLHDRIHVRRIAAEVNDDDRAGAIGQHRPDCFSRDVAAIALHIGKDGDCSGIHDARRRSDEAARRDHDFIASADAQSFERDIQGDGAVHQRDRVARADPICELALELATFFASPVIYPVGAEHGSDGFRLLVAEARPWRERRAQHVSPSPAAGRDCLQL